MASRSWTVEILPKAQRVLDSFRREYGDNAYQEVLQQILDLEEDPTPPHAERLRRTKDLYRIYAYRSLYRIVYQVSFGQQSVYIIRFGPRPTVYSGFDRW